MSVRGTAHPSSAMMGPSTTRWPLSFSYWNLFQTGKVRSVSVPGIVFLLWNPRSIISLLTRLYNFPPARNHRQMSVNCNAELRLYYDFLKFHQGSRLLRPSSEKKKPTEITSKVTAVSVAWHLSFESCEIAIDWWSNSSGSLNRAERDTAHLSFDLTFELYTNQQNLAIDALQFIENPLHYRSASSTRTRTLDVYKPEVNCNEFIFMVHVYLNTRSISVGFENMWANNTAEVLDIAEADR